MKNKQKEPEESKRVKTGFKAALKWVLNNLSEEKLHDMEGRIISDENILEFLLWCVDIGIDVKITHDAFAGTYTAIAIGAWVGFPSEGYATAGRSGRDISDALNILWYKIAVLADGDLSSIPTEKDIDRMRG